ncbi:conjugal transfer protein (plasmid) [Pantoea allii]|uniref:conjugal transfer protein n=1 Tax=Pantoea TaxID=53335 RepID=UPI000B5A921C|nr:conjugal transfer protein [Pantoea sp. AMG 501]OWY74690.1 conjugal transfer protein [Pantoea sp. AMG 501]
MSDSDKPVYPPGYWRYAGLDLDFVGVPGYLFLFYLFWFRFPSLDTLYLITAIIAFFRLLSAFGWTLSKILTRLTRLFRGTSLSGRPWWYRRFTGGE